MRGLLSSQPRLQRNKYYPRILLHVRFHVPTLSPLYRECTHRLSPGRDHNCYVDTINVANSVSTGLI